MGESIVRVDGPLQRRIALFEKELIFSTFRALQMDVVCVGEKSLSTDDDTDCEERGGEGVNNIIQQKSTWATKKRQNWVVICHEQSCYSIQIHPYPSYTEKYT